MTQRQVHLHVRPLWRSSIGQPSKTELHIRNLRPHDHRCENLHKPQRRICCNIFKKKTKRLDSGRCAFLSCTSFGQLRSQTASLLIFTYFLPLPLPCSVSTMFFIAFRTPTKNQKKRLSLVTNLTNYFKATQLIWTISCLNWPQLRAMISRIANGTSYTSMYVLKKCFRRQFMLNL